MVGYAKQDKKSRQYAHMDGWMDVDIGVKEKWKDAF